jgi:RNA polymerase sigma-70 factor (sigma-E family)
VPRSEAPPSPAIGAPTRTRVTMVAVSTAGGGSVSAKSRPVTAYGGPGFEEFIHAEFPRLWRLGRVLSGRDEDAWDLAQEALVKVGTHWSRIDRGGNPGAYARTCLVRLHIAGTRRRRRETLVEPAHLELAAASRGLESDAVDRADEVARLLVQLPPRQRAAVTLHYLEDLSVRDIATILRISEGTVKSQLARGRATLQRRVADPDVGNQSSGREGDQR